MASLGTTLVCLQCLLFTMAQQPAEKTPGQDTRGRPGRTAPGLLPAPAPADPNVIKVIPLQQARANAAAASLRELLAIGGIVSDERTNSILFNGPAQSLAKLAELVPLIDVAVQNRQGSELALIPVQHRGAEGIAGQIMSALAHEDIRVAVDAGRSVLILNGPPAAIEHARAIIKQLDTPAARVSMEFNFFRGTAGAAASSIPMPEDLQAIGKELERFGGIELIGRMSATAVEGESFEVEGQLLSEFSGEVRGRLEEATDQGSVRVNMEAKLMMVDLASAEGSSKGAINRGVFRAATTVVLQRGDFVVIGSSPAGMKGGDSVILVLNIRNSNGLQ